MVAHMSAARVIFHGKVQGVFFRANTRKKALELGVRGWVRNLPNGTVEAFFEGNMDQINAIIDYCKNHQPYARVEKVDIRWCSEQGYKGFEIRY